jgi:hypothetical protein
MVVDSNAAVVGRGGAVLFVPLGVLCGSVFLLACAEPEIDTKITAINAEKRKKFIFN